MSLCTAALRLKAGGSMLARTGNQGTGVGLRVAVSKRMVVFKCTSMTEVHRFCLQFVHTSQQLTSIPSNSSQQPPDAQQQVDTELPVHYTAYLLVINVQCASRSCLHRQSMLTESFLCTTQSTYL